MTRSPDTGLPVRDCTEPLGLDEGVGRTVVFEGLGRVERVAPEAPRVAPDDELLPEALDGFFAEDGDERGAGFVAGRAFEDDRGAGCDLELDAGLDCELGAGLGLADDERLWLDEARDLLEDEDDERFEDDGADALERLDVVFLFGARSSCTGRRSQPIVSSREPASTGDCASQPTKSNPIIVLPPSLCRRIVVDYIQSKPTRVDFVVNVRHDRARRKGESCSRKAI